MIISGRDGRILYDPAGTTPVEVASLKEFKISWKTAREDVTCYGNTNKVYVPGLPDVQGTVGGFWDASDLTLFEAAMATTPGMLELIPHESEATTKFSGLAYLDAELDHKVDASPRVTGTWSAAGNWTLAHTP